MSAASFSLRKNYGGYLELFKDVKTKACFEPLLNLMLNFAFASATT